MYPIKFENLYYEKIWGGRKLEEYRINLPKGNIGESWEIACHKNGMSIVSNGKYKGKALIEIIKKYKNLIVGDKIYTDKFTDKDFPLLIKIINSNDNLSVQVHPNDEYAHRLENDNGKVEAWYIIDCEEEAEIIVGTKGCTKEEFKRSCEDGTVEDCMNKISVKPGELFLIEPGLLHSIGKGILLAEIQQNSDITYRVYDYHRGRKLHVDKALDVINFNDEPKIICIKNNLVIENYTNLEKFNIDIYNIKGSYNESSDKNKFFIFTCVEGKGKISFIDEGVRQCIDISTLESFLIPAYLGDYILIGNMKLIKSYIF
ncbi:type I phosphomannose isomerase catalytic subunit [uncultured Clostridium sp.]|uniref:type I phosphomannose isomerase catalytic subunit n=1 Tax=uncultured Clostridium sp. TaxID=59620 RepID=UPI003217DB25